MSRLAADVELDCEAAPEAESGEGPGRSKLASLQRDSRLSEFSSG